ncbi:MAG: DUF4918 family protein [Lewinella sp.]|nr:DUF4918 family protein [Lewinella sp.]
MTFAQQVLDFHFSLPAELPVPKGIEVLYPYGEAMTQACMRDFYKKYYGEETRRVFIFGINPGRFGAGVTGVPFTDPIRLAEVCGIENDFPPKRELSSEFVYDIVDHYGGPAAFYAHFYISSLSPLGFVRHGKNFNYYDQKSLERAVTPFIVDSIRRQQAFGAVREVALCLGEGKNYQFFTQLNDEYKFFDEIIPLPHPRYVMQYRRKYLDEYRARYLAALMKGAAFL